MKIITFLNPKGGVGKSTLTFHTAVCLAEKKAVLVIDIDPQCTVTKIGDTREQEDPTIISIQAERIESAIATAKEGGADYVLIDCRGTSERALSLAARASDLVLIPSAPTIIDMREVLVANEIIELAGKKPVVLLNKVHPSARTVHESIDGMLAENGIELASTYISQRADFSNSLNESLGVTEYAKFGKATEEIRSLCSFIVKRTK